MIDSRTKTVRENARIQGFDDKYRFAGSREAKRRQVGNAVPPPLGQALGWQIRAVISGEVELGQSAAKEIRRPVEKIKEAKAEKRGIDGMFKHVKKQKSWS